MRPRFRFYFFFLCSFFLYYCYKLLFTLQTKHIKMDAYFLYLTSKLEKLRTGPERSLLDMKREILSWDLWRGTLAEGIATMLFVFIGTASIVFPIGEALTSAKIVKVSVCHFMASGYAWWTPPPPAEVGNILSWRLIMKYFLRSFSPFR